MFWYSWAYPQTSRDDHVTDFCCQLQAEIMCVPLQVKLVKIHRLNFGIFFISFRRRQWKPTPVLLPGKSHGRRSLVGCSPWDREESNTTEQLHFHFSLSCIEEVNGNPLQCSGLENPRDGGAWWAAVYGCRLWGRTESDMIEAT